MMIPMRSTRPLRVALAAALFAVLPAHAPAQNGVTAAPPSAATTAPVTDSATGAPLAAASGEASGLPVPSGPPRTLRAYWHVFAAFTIAWLLVFGYALSLGRRFSKLEREIGRGALS